MLCKSDADVCTTAHHHTAHPSVVDDPFLCSLSSSYPSVPFLLPRHLTFEERAERKKKKKRATSFHIIHFPTVCLVTYHHHAGGGSCVHSSPLIIKKEKWKGVLTHSHTDIVEYI